MKEKNLLIFGVGEFAQIAYEYFSWDSEYLVKGFVVDNIHKSNSEFLGLPVYATEDLQNISYELPFDIFVAISGREMNTMREEVFHRIRNLGFNLASYVSSKAFIWHDVEIGKNVFIFENNVLQIGVEVGDNTILWSGNHIGHRSKIGKNVFLSSHCVISGFCIIGDNSYLGVNCTIIDQIVLAEYSLVGASSLINKNTEPFSINVGSPFRKLDKKSISSIS